jgi:hypothetical protein
MTTNVQDVFDHLKYNIVVDPSNVIRYYLNGQLHREDGPAVIWADGGKEWWYNGEPFYNQLLNKSSLDKYL